MSIQGNVNRTDVDVHRCHINVFSTHSLSSMYQSVLLERVSATLANGECMSECICACGLLYVSGHIYTYIERVNNDGRRQIVTSDCMHSTLSLIYYTLMRVRSISLEWRGN